MESWPVTSPPPPSLPDPGDDAPPLDDMIEPGNTSLVVTVIGGQGFIFGRGNQQISPAVLRAVGKDNIMVISTPSKLGSLFGSALFVDTGDPSLDRDLCGYMRLITGPGEETMFRVER